MHAVFYFNFNFSQILDNQQLILSLYLLNCTSYLKYTKITDILKLSIKQK